MATYEELLEDRIDIEAPAGVVWGLVSDVRQLAQFSPQVESCTYDDEGEEQLDGHAEGQLDGQGHVGVGTRFTNHNVHGDLRWSTHGAIVRYVPEQELAFRVEENRVVWVFLLHERPGGGTTLTQQRTTPEGISEESLRLTDAYMGGQQRFTETMRHGMRQTLQAIKAAAERP